MPVGLSFSAFLGGCGTSKPGKDSSFGRRNYFSQLIDINRKHRLLFRRIFVIIKCLFADYWPFTLV